MNKAAYCKIPEVNYFIKYLADKICGKFPHEYIVRQTGEKWACTNIKDAALKYKWPWRGAQNSLRDNALELNRLEKNLNAALKAKKASDLVDCSIEVFKWGGVLNGNKNRVIVNEAQLIKLYSDTVNQLCLEGDDGILGNVFNMNSGFTKIYSMLSTGMIIYDSRVGAALGYLVKQCADFKSWSDIPAELLFPYAPARNAPTTTNPLTRNPGPFAGVHFPSFSGRPGLQTIFMLRASWIIDEVINTVGCILDQELKCNNPTIPKHRILEAGLFMIGYDLPKDNNNKTKKSIKNTHPQSKPPLLTYVTLKKQCKFSAKLDSSKSKIEFETNRRVPSFKTDLDLILNSLRWLVERYGTVDFFQLDNSADAVKKVGKHNGFGTAFCEQNKKFNRPDASYIAALLVKIDILEYNYSTVKPEKYRINIFPTKKYLVELLEKEFSGGMDDSDE